MKKRSGTIAGLHGGSRSLSCCLLSLWAIALLPFAGCSASHELETAPVRGTVTLDGKPLGAGEISFVPTKGRGAAGLIAADGSYTLNTYSDGDGAVVGRHTVTVYPRYPRSEVDELPANARMVSRAHGGIEVEVEAVEENVIDIPLSSQP